MSPFTAVTFFSVLTVAGQVLSLFLLVLLLARVRRLSFVSEWFGSHGLLLMCIVALSGTFGSLYFSEIAGWTPCKLCWFQRIFLYPQVILLIVALWRRDRQIAQYILILSLIGMAFAAVHYGEQVQLALNPMNPDLGKPCDATGVSCARTPIFAFGYITLPMMALTAFIMNAVGSIFVLRTSRQRA